MSKIEQLIQKYCPDGVEWVKLGECINSLSTGLNPRKFFKLNTDDATNFYVTIREIHNNTIVFNEKTDLINDEALRLCNNRSHLEKGDVLFSGTGTIGEVAALEETPINWNIKEGVYAIKPISSILNYRYLMYLLQSTQIRQSYLKKAAGGTVRSVPMGEMRNLLVPLPPLPVQEEIVKYLDTFSELQAKLQTELQARRRQYDYYQNLLLNKSQFTQHISVGDVCDIIKGKTPIQKARDGIYPLVVTTSERKSCDTYQFDTNAVCIPLVSSRGHGVASLNHVFYQEGKFALGNILCAVIPRETILKAKFLYYYLEYAKDFILVPLMKGGANVSLHSYDIEKVKIPLPTIQEQERIIAILDTFDTLVNDLSQGLPAEIEARRQQYEYYRDKLLSFKKKA